MVPIRQNLVSSSKYSIKCPYTMEPKGITVHNTANNASAENEIAYMVRNNLEVSYHYAVDDIEIIQGIPENRNAWHAGDGNNGTGNRKTISIEICYSTGDKAKFERAQENAAEFIAYKLKEKGWGIDKVYTHEHWSGKHCPHRTLDEYGWDYFIGLINKYLNGGTSTPTTNTTTTTTNINITYQTWDDVKNTWLPNVNGNSDYAGIFGHDVCAVFANLSEGDCVYRTHTQGGSWLPEVKNRADYAGIFNKPIDGFMIKATDSNVKIHYQVHIRGGNWLPYVTGYTANDSNNGYAGIIGKPIDGIRMYAEKTTTQVVNPAPAPAPAPEPTPAPVVEYFRVRTSWADSKSQKGAYKSLEGAIAKCQECGEGYKVFDNNGNEVYTYVKPVEPAPVKPETTPVVPPVVEPEAPVVEPETPVEPEAPIEPEAPVEPETVNPENSNIDNTTDPKDTESKSETDTDLNSPEVDSNKINSILILFEKILKIILSWFSKK